MIKYILAVFLLLTSSPSYSDQISDINLVFNWAEKTYPEFFSPTDQLSKYDGIWSSRYYKNTNNSILFNKNNGYIYLYGEDFPELTQTSSLYFLLSIIKKEENINLVFDWAERNYPDFFSPVNQPTKRDEAGYSRYYNNTNNSIFSYDDGYIYLLGEDFPKLTQTSPLHFLLSLVKKEKVVNANIGINLSPIVDWTSNLNFLNVFRRSRAWISQPQNGSAWDDERVLSIDSNGYITSLQSNQRAVSILFVNPKPGKFHCETGRYKFTYEGEGDFSFTNDATLISHDRNSKSAVVEFTNNKCELVLFQINSTNPDNYLRNFTLVHEQYLTLYTNGEIFHPRLLSNISEFSVLRFMDWGETNHSIITNWSNRTTPQSLSYNINKEGVALEAMIDLANETLITPWFCIPHQADDNYIQKFAHLVKDRLNPDLKFYVEYSNETWNGLFSQKKYTIEQGKTLNLNNDSSLSGQLFHWKRTSEIGEIVATIFSSSDNLETINKYNIVLGSQSSGSWFAKKGYEYLENIKRIKYIDSIAIAPYIGGYLGESERSNIVSTYSVEQLLNFVEEDITTVMGEVSEYVEFFKPKKFPIIAYEGGQHLVGMGSAQSNDTLTALFKKANQSSRMGDIYKTYLNQWSYITNNSLMTLFTSSESTSKYGNFGLKEHDQQTDATKYNTVIDWIGGN